MLVMNNFIIKADYKDTVLYDKEYNLYADNKNIIWLEQTNPLINIIEIFGKLLNLDDNSICVLKAIYNLQLTNDFPCNKQTIIDCCMKLNRKSNMTYIRAIDKLEKKRIITTYLNKVKLTSNYNIYDYIKNNNGDKSPKYMILQLY